MKKQISHISPVQAGKVFGALYMVTMVPVVVLVGLVMMGLQNTHPVLGGVGVVIGSLVAMVLYGLFAFLFACFGAWAYNLVAPHTGGLLVTVEEAAAR